MLISREKTDLIEGTPMGFKIYEAVHEAAHFHSDCLEVVFCVRGKKDRLYAQAAADYVLYLHFAKIRRG